ncbi:MAG: DUF2147 domain-containing protein [Rhodopseudomonas sp.]|nr:DUF2147 domain-containing protein [Rhodopseudomonas sp.]
MAIAGPSNGIMGIWQRGDGAARIRMDPCGDKICATNIWIRNPARQNEHVGDKLIFRIKPNGNDWIGEAYDPQRHLSMSAKLMPSGDTMISTGCVLGGIICRSSRWARIETAPQR